jgi:hypothetical protein
MADSVDNKLLLLGVEALYPRINRTYRFDATENRTVPCAPTDNNACYELRFKFSEPEAKALYKKMKAYWLANKKDEWPDKLPLPFEVSEDDEGVYIGKARKKGAYDAELTTPPAVYDAGNNLIKDKDFLLTTGSIINIGVTMVPYLMPSSYGVSLRLNAVQVLKLEPMVFTSPFDATEGYIASDDNEDEEDNPFKDKVADDEDDDEMPAPKPKKKPAKKKASKAKDESDDEVVVSKKKKRKATDAAEEEGLGDIIEKWDD